MYEKGRVFVLFCIIPQGFVCIIAGYFKSRRS